MISNCRIDVHGMAAGAESHWGNSHRHRRSKAGTGEGSPNSWLSIRIQLPKLLMLTWTDTANSTAVSISRLVLCFAVSVELGLIE